MAAHNQFVLLGPQGSGKGTQAKMLAERLGVPHISTGDMFRDHVARHTELGAQIEALLKAGQLVPDEVTNALVKERLAQADAASGFVLDGYPRNLAQANFLNVLAPQVRAIELTLTDEEAVQRIARRRVCARCGATYHLDFAPPQADGVCDKCGGQLAQRSDDTEAAVRDRLATYHRATASLLEYYQARAALTSIDGAPPIPEVTEHIQRAIG